jgi:hypothetical protein
MRTAGTSCHRPRVTRPARMVQKAEPLLQRRGAKIAIRITIV